MITHLFTMLVVGGIDDGGNLNPPSGTWTFSFSATARRQQKMLSIAQRLLTRVMNPTMLMVRVSNSPKSSKIRRQQWRVLLVFKRSLEHDYLTETMSVRALMTQNKCRTWFHTDWYSIWEFCKFSDMHICQVLAYVAVHLRKGLIVLVWGVSIHMYIYILIVSSLTLPKAACWLTL